MGEVVDEYERFGRLIVSGAKAPRALLVFGHELTRAVDLRTKRYDLVRRLDSWLVGLCWLWKQLNCRAQSSFGHS